MNLKIVFVAQRDSSAARNIAVLSEDLDLIPSIHRASHNHLELQLQEILYLLLVSMGTKHSHGAHTYMQVK